MEDFAMNKYLTRKVRQLRENIGKPIEGTPRVTLVQVCGKVYQLLFLSCGCKNACTFCNYGFDYDLTKETVMPELEKIILENYDIEVLELEANGSFLDEREIPHDLFISVLEFVKGRNIPEIEIETHYRTVTEGKLRVIREILGKDQEIAFEFGFESSSERVRRFYNKDIDNDEFVKVLELCKKYEISAGINVLLGAPFLSREQQIKDCLDTLDFIYGNCPKGTRCILFPINIKAYTMLDVWRKKGLYKQISSWEFVEFLYRIPEKYYDRFTIAWWGERGNTFSDPNEITHPITCEKCHDELMDFYKKFYLSKDPVYKRKLVCDVWAKRCECDM